jgi:hypothetical protein
MQSKWSAQHLEDEYVWRWRIEYRKFRSGNSSSAEEQSTGADGIFQIEVERFRIDVLPSGLEKVSIENVDIEFSFKKGMLFQAKRFDSREGPNRLLGQLKNMEMLTPQNAMYLEYGPHGYRAAKAADVIGVDGVVNRLEKSKAPSLGKLMTDEFFECKVGVEGLFVDFDKETLNFPKGSEEISQLMKDMKHGLRVRVKAFTMSPFRQDA